MSKQLELPITPRRRVAVYDDPPGSEPGSAEIADIDFDAAIQKATDVVNAAGPTMKAMTRLVDGASIKLTPWFGGDVAQPQIEGWYEVMVEGQELGYHAYYHAKGEFFRTVNYAGITNDVAAEFCAWRGLTQPAPGGYGKDRGARVTRTPVIPRRRVVLVD